MVRQIYVGRPALDPPRLFESRPSYRLLGDDLWRNIVREYSEELLGTPAHDGTRSKPIDYDSWPLYRELEDAQVARRSRWPHRVLPA